MPHQIDETDLEILRELQRNARQTNQEIAIKIGIAPSTLTRRLQWLEEEKVIKGYTCVVSADVLGYTTVGYTLVRFAGASRKHVDRVIERLKEVPEVAEICKIFGDDDLIVKMYARGNENYQNVLENLGPSTSDEEYHTKTLLVTQVSYDGGVADIVNKSRNLSEK